VLCITTTRPTVFMCSHQLHYLSLRNSHRLKVENPSVQTHLVLLCCKRLCISSDLSVLWVIIIIIIINITIINVINIIINCSTRGLSESERMGFQLSVYASFSN